MKQKLNDLSQRYVTALRKRLKPGARAGLQPALAIGRQAVALGVETLELARIHERAVTSLELASRKDGFLKRDARVDHALRRGDGGRRRRRAGGLNAARRLRGLREPKSPETGSHRGSRQRTEAHP